VAYSPAFLTFCLRSPPELNTLSIARSPVAVHAHNRTPFPHLHSSRSDEKGVKALDNRPLVAETIDNNHFEFMCIRAVAHIWLDPFQDDSYNGATLRACRAGCTSTSKLIRSLDSLRKRFQCSCSNRLNGWAWLQLG